MRDNTMAAPLDWIKTVERALVDLDEKPQFGLQKTFPWEELEKGLADLFENASLKLNSQTEGWASAETALGDNLEPLSILWAPIKTPIYFATSSIDLKRLMAELFQGDRQAAFFLDDPLVKAFYLYFAAEVLRQIDALHFASPLSPSIEETDIYTLETVRNEPCFEINLSLSLNDKTFSGKLWITEAFRSAWKAFFASEPTPALSEEMRREIMVELALEIGYSDLGLNEWKKVGEGDFIILDRCSYDPQTRGGGVILTMDQKPLFRGRFKEGGIKLTSYPTYQEADKSMDDEFDHDEDEDFDDEDEDIFSDDEDEDEVEEETEEEEASLAAVQEDREKPSITPEELPVHLTIEAGRVKMSVAELMNLAPGNLIDLRVFPEQGVDLVINGKKVGRGELIRMGETLGVRILSL